MGSGDLMVVALVPQPRKVLLGRRCEVTIGTAGVAHVARGLALKISPFSLALGCARAGINIVRQGGRCGADDEGYRESNLRVGEHGRVSCDSLLTPCWCAGASCLCNCVR